MSAHTDDWKADLRASKTHVDDLDQQLRQARAEHHLKILHYEKDHLQREIAEVLGTKQAVISLIIKRTRENLAREKQPKYPEHS